MYIWVFHTTVLGTREVTIFAKCVVLVVFVDNKNCPTPKSFP